MIQSLSLSRFSSPDRITSLFILLAAVVSSLFLSPKWLSASSAWISPFLWLYFFASGTMHRKWVWGYLSLLLSQFITIWEVNPFPLPIVIIMALVDSLKTILIYAIVIFGIRKYPSGPVIFVLPVLMTAKEYMESFGGGGTWSSIAYSQYTFKWLVQLVSVTGIWGITFLIYWFASTLYFFLVHSPGRNKVHNISFVAIFAAVMIFGAIRYSGPNEERNILEIGGLTVPMTKLMESVYGDYFGEDIRLPETLSQSSPIFSKVNTALGAFIENPDSVLFNRTFSAMNHLHDSLFNLSAKLADSGAKLIVWSEGNGMVLRNHEEKLVEKARHLAAGKQIYLLMSLASFEPGKINPGKKFLENKTHFIGPQGNLLNTFHKNKPVPIVEPTEPGDGTIPVIQTLAGNFSPSICYDADFPGLIRQAGKQKTELLLLPSGDWKAISPYHSYMAVFRAVENGFSLVRQVNNGYSIATDYRGKKYGELDFFQASEKIMMAKIPVRHVPTLYTYAGDILAIVCLIFAGFILLWIAVIQTRIILSKSRVKFKKTDYFHQ